MAIVINTAFGVRAKKMKPTKKHRPAMWEMMLGTVNAMNDKGEVKYFDYDYEAAKKFAISDKEDLRIWKAEYNKRMLGFATDIRKGQSVLYVVI